MSKTENKAKKKSKKQIIIRLAVILGIIAVLGGTGYFIYNRHMAYDIQEHVNYNIEKMQAEGRTYGDYSAVYFTSDISPEGLKKAYDALGRQLPGKVAVKLSTGEAGNPNYLSPDLIKELVAEVDGTIVECNTAYSGSKRMETEMHLQVAKDHGFTEIADVDIMDRDGHMVIPVDGGVHLKENWVGKNLADYDSMLVLTHFKGHPMGGFGGALKNISIGVASSEGKVRIHSGGVFKKPTITLSALTINQDVFTDSMAEAAKSVYDYEGHGDKILFVSVMNRMSVDCDCVSTPAEPDIHDIGILSSLDPVALDQACVDLVFDAKDGDALRNRILSLNGLNILKHAEEIGFGNRAYELISLD